MGLVLSVGAETMHFDEANRLILSAFSELHKICCCGCGGESHIVMI